MHESVKPITSGGYKWCDTVENTPILKIFLEIFD